MPLSLKRRSLGIAALLFAATTLGASPAVALAAGPLSITTRMLVERRVAAADGTTRSGFVAPTRVVPGDRIAVVLAYRNTGAVPLGGVVLANPVPQGMAYRTADAGAELSVDGRTFGPLASLRVATTDGTTRAATLDDVTHVRWRLSSPVTAGAGGEVQFQAVLK